MRVCREYRTPCLRMGLHAVAASQLVFSSFHPVDQTNVVKLRQKA